MLLPNAEFLSVGIGTNDASDTQEIRTAKGLAVALMWIRQEAITKGGQMIMSALPDLADVIMGDHEEEKRENKSVRIDINKKELLRQIEELKEEEENGQNSQRV